MKRLGFLSLATLALWFGVSQAQQLKGRDPRTGKEPLPVVQPATDPLEATEPDGTCGSFGTKVEFFPNPSEAAKRALKDEKLVLVLHVSGLFEDPRFT